MGQSKVHYCYNQQLGEPRPSTCRCRKYLTYADAAREVRLGFAQWVTIGRTRLHENIVCPLCLGEDIKKNCQNCKKTGIVECITYLDMPGNDIVIISTASKNEKGEDVYRSPIAQQTPRVATIEEEHILRAYVDGNAEEAQRIEEYGIATLEARVYTGKDEIFTITYEPLDDPDSGVGRGCDWGRPTFCRISDERTQGSDPYYCNTLRKK